MHKGLFSEFYTLCAATITIAILVIAVVFIMVSSEFYKNDKKSFIIPNAESVIASTQNSGITEDGPDAERLGELYSDLTNTTGIVFTLTDSSGVALVCSEAPPCSHKGKNFAVYCRGGELLPFLKVFRLCSEKVSIENSNIFRCCFRNNACDSFCSDLFGGKTSYNAC